MQTQQMENPQAKNFLASITYSFVINLMWKMRWMVIILTLAFAGAIIAWVLRTATYESEGLFLFWGSIPVPKPALLAPPKMAPIIAPPGPGIALPDYKRYLAVLLRKSRFDVFVKEHQLESAPGVAELRRKFASRNGIASNIQPVFPFSRDEAKDIPANLRENNNRVIGLNLSYTHASPERAQQIVKLLGAYIMDSITYSSVTEMVQRRQDELQTDFAELDSNALTNKLNLIALERKVKELKDIATRNAKFSAGSNQILTITQDTVRYISPSTQLMAAEVEIMELNAIMRSDSEKQKKAKLLLEYNDRLRQMAAKSYSGTAILKNLESVRAALFKDKLMSDDINRLAYNEIFDENLKITQVYGEKSNFVATPSLPVYSTARPAIMGAIGLLIGFILSLLLVLGREWLLLTKNKTGTV